MELRQLEYFVTAVEEKSFYKTATKLYTSQPAISKAVALLEKDVNAKLFDRTSKGLKITPKGEKLYNYAKNILRQVDIMKEVEIDCIELRISSYPSKFISSTIADFYVENNNFKIDYREGTVQDIINFVYKGISEFGIVYISPKQKDVLSHILEHKNLEFVPMKESKLCVYVGKNNKLYSSGTNIEVDELSKLNYVRGVRDFFSVEHHFDIVSLNEISTNNFNDVVLTNSDHLVNQILEKSDLCYLGIDTKVSDNKGKIQLNSEEKLLILGYIKSKNAVMNELSLDFIEYLISKNK